MYPVQTTNNYSPQPSYDQTVSHELQYGDTFTSSKGNILRYYGYDAPNYVFETDERITQEEFDELISSQNLDASQRYQLTFQHGELFAVYAYVESGIIKYSEDAPKSKKDLQKYIENCEYDDVKEFIDRAFELAPKIKNEMDKTVAIDYFRDAADRLEEYRVKFGNSNRYKTLKNYYYQRQKAKLGLSYAKTIDDGAKTVAQEIEEQRLEQQKVEQTKKQQERIVNANGFEYYLPKQTAGCYTKEDLELFDELSYARDYDGMNQMIYTGRAVLVGPGPCAMLDRGFTVTKIRIDGRVLYLDSSDVKSK